MDNKESLKNLSKEIKSLEKKREEIIISVMQEVKKTIRQWATTLPLEDFKIAIRNLYVESYNKRHGTDFFTWNSTPKIQDKFEWYVKKIIEGESDENSKKKEDKFFYYKPLNRFFVLKKFKMLTTSRSSMVTEKYDVNKDGNLVYEYSGTAYHGFGSVDNSVQQELVIDLDKMIVFSYTDSTDKYSPRSSGIHKINTDFIDGWIDFSRQMEVSGQTF